MTNKDLSETGEEWLKQAASVGLFKRSAIADLCGIPRVTFYRVLATVEKGGHAPSDRTRRRFETGIDKRRSQIKKEGKEHGTETDIHSTAVL